MSLSPKNLLRFLAHVQMLPILESGEETLVGGQAVMEGVMMRAPHSYCTAVRKPNGEIVTEQAAIPKVSEKYPIFRFPILRGIGTLGQAMWLGVKALQFSANAQMEEGDKKQEVSSRALGFSLAFSLVFTFFLYKYVPLVITTKLASAVPSLQGQVASNVVDGVIRIVIFLGFLFVLSRMRDIRRVFEYHGAEHKVVFNFESGQDVCVENAQRFPTWHPRCGTSFLIVVMVISMIIYTMLPFSGFWEKLLSRAVLFLPIAGISYEVIRFAAKRRGGLMATLTRPGLWLQRITTNPPSNEQTGIAIHALDGAMRLEKEQGGELVIA